MTRDDLLNFAAPEYGSQSSRVATAQPAAGDPTLKSDSILIAEFEYAASSAHDAVEDRARIFDRYLLFCGGAIVTGVGAIYQLNQIGAKSVIEPLAVGAFLLTGLLGFVFLRTFVRLRQAFVGSMIVMSKIKEYYLYHLRAEAPHLDIAFDWRLRTVPETDRRFTVSYLMAHLVASIDSLSFGVGAFVLVELILNKNDGNTFSHPHNLVPYVVGVVVAALALTLQLAYYWRACKGMSHDEKKAWLDELHAGASQV